MTENDQETIRRAMSLMGSARSDRKRQASTENAAKARAAHYPTLLPCSCGQVPHKYRCPVARRERSARKS